MEKGLAARQERRKRDEKLPELPSGKSCNGTKTRRENSFTRQAGWALAAEQVEYWKKDSSFKFSGSTPGRYRESYSGGEGSGSFKNTEKENSDPSLSFGSLFSAPKYQNPRNGRKNDLGDSICEKEKPVHRPFYTKRQTSSKKRGGPVRVIKL